MEYTLLLIAAVAVLGTPSVQGAAKLPADIERCKRNDPKLNECLHDAMQKAMPQISLGIPKLGGIPLDPLEVTYLEVNQGSGPISINLKFRDMKIHGLSKTVVGTVRADLDKYELQIEVAEPHLDFEGDYEMDGKILVLPVTGKGRFNLTTINLKGTGGPKGVSIKKNGQDFFDVKEYIMMLETPAGLTAHFENLFNGDKALDISRKWCAKTTEFFTKDGHTNSHPGWNRRYSTRNKMAFNDEQRYISL